MICNRCLQKLSINPKNIQQINLNYIGIDEKLGKLICSNCKICTHLSKTGNDWKNIDSWLCRDKKRNGPHEIEGEDDLFKLFILSQILYNEIECELGEVIFDFPDKTDFIKILWKDGNAIGFYTIKLKDSLVHDTGETYGMTTLDTAFIRKSYRRRGFGLSILEDITKSFPDEHIGISTPISHSMYFVIYKFLNSYPTYKLKLWEITGVGNKGNRKLIFFSVRSLFS